MKDKTVKIMLGIIALNLTFQNVKDVGLFPTAYAQSGVQKVAICDSILENNCASVFEPFGDGIGRVMTSPPL